MTKKTKCFIAFLPLAALLGLGSAAQADDADDVIAAARAQWASIIADESATKQMATVADDYTEFNPTYPTRLDGKAMNMTLAEVYTNDATKTTSGDMANEKVQIYGDVAILSYNYIGTAQNKDGEIEPVTAKSTRVYVKQRGKWMLVHANFAPVNSSDD